MYYYCRLYREPSIILHITLSILRALQCPTIMCFDLLRISPLYFTKLFFNEQKHILVLRRLPLDSFVGLRGQRHERCPPLVQAPVSILSLFQRARERSKVLFPQKIYLICFKPEHPIFLVSSLEIWGQRTLRSFRRLHKLVQRARVNRSLIPLD